ncbi:hypothetical protein D920_02748 [Enterococcus faecalis 13-SD-W-01]|nr:hypothetical protein D920_02748 [Enterococcus faecalis 13-SD-W-01]
MLSDKGRTLDHQGFFFYFLLFYKHGGHVVLPFIFAKETKKGQTKIHLLSQADSYLFIQLSSSDL